ncbi:NADH-quinone oxidoreductase subunit B family protein [Sulfolobus tengchongensis]|uniref:NADH-quinone oxidoreductase subunit B family protein n=1 Tax=Sulfolobus tengchongensis TaxID=207809 RepID=A0AAX4L3C0_9CREN
MKNWWFVRGLKKGILTEESPKDIAEWSTEIEGKGDVVCPTNAIENEKWIKERCIFCRLCYPNYRPNLNPRIYTIKSINTFFKKSFYLYPIDSGTCGGCNLELKLISAPQYDMTRFGIFFTNTPRHADALVVMGILTEKMREVLEKAYDAMPEPKLVILLGTCAVSGGILGEKIPLDSVVEIPGCPPNPYTILEALREVKGK